MTATEYVKVVDGRVVAIERKRDPASAINPDDGGPVWRPLVREKTPDYDPSTHKAAPVAYVIDADRVIARRAVVELTAEEIDQAKDARVPPEFSAMFKILYNQERRLRALEGKALPTPRQFRTALKGLL